MQVSRCRVCALSVIGIRLKSTSDGVHRSMGRNSAALGGARRAVASTIGGTRTAS